MGYTKMDWMGIANAGHIRHIKKRKHKAWKKKHPKAAKVRQYLAADKDDRATNIYWMWRKAVLKRDKYQCQECGKKGFSIKLHAHHIKDWYAYKSLRFNLQNGKTLCEDCHILKHPFMNPERYKELNNPLINIAVKSILRKKSL